MLGSVQKRTRMLWLVSMSGESINNTGKSMNRCWLLIVVEDFFLLIYPLASGFSSIKRGRKYLHFGAKICFGGGWFALPAGLYFRLRHVGVV